MTASEVERWNVDPRIGVPDLNWGLAGNSGFLSSSSSKFTLRLLGLRSTFVPESFKKSSYLIRNRLMTHGVWKSQKKPHSTLRAKRTTFTFWVDKSLLKMVQFGEFLKTWSLRSNSVTRQVNINRTKIGEKYQNSNATFWVIFKRFGFFKFHRFFGGVQNVIEMQSYFTSRSDTACKTSDLESVTISLHHYGFGARKPWCSVNFLHKKRN